MPAFLDLDLQETAKVVHRRASVAELALLLDRRRLRVALGDDQPAQRRAVLARHLLPDRLAHLVTEADLAIGNGIGEEEAPAVIRDPPRARMRPAPRIDPDRRSQ